jgi:hypothetical protein
MASESQPGTNDLADLTSMIRTSMPGAYDKFNYKQAYILNKEAQIISKSVNKSLGQMFKGKKVNKETLEKEKELDAFFAKHAESDTNSDENGETNR